MRLGQEMAGFPNPSKCLFVDQSDGMDDQVARIRTGQWDRRLAGWPSLLAPGSSNVICCAGLASSTQRTVENGCALW